jgi:hypothetical protein
MFINLTGLRSPSRRSAAKSHEVKLMICFTDARCIGFLLHLLLQSSGSLLCCFGSTVELEFKK